MPTHLEIVQETNRKVLQRLDAEEKKLNEQEKQARDWLDGAVARRRKIAEQRAAVLAVQALQVAALAETKLPEPPPASASPKGPAMPEAVQAEPSPTVAQRRARIGPQRYAILTALRAEGPLNIESLVKATGLSAKRIKDQFRADIPAGIVGAVTIPLKGGEAVEAYTLVPEGQTLLERFEAYKRSRKEPLPTPAEAIIAELEGDPEDGEEAEEQQGASP